MGNVPINSSFFFFWKSHGPRSRFILFLTRDTIMCRFLRIIRNKWNTDAFIFWRLTANISTWFSRTFVFARKPTMWYFVYYTDRVKFLRYKNSIPSKWTVVTLRIRFFMRSLKSYWVAAFDKIRMLLLKKKITRKQFIE